MSAEIIRFVPRPRRDRGLDRESTTFYSPWRPDDLAMAHADTAPCEYAPPLEMGCDDDTPA
jgi:hypothetical protein